MRELPHTHSCFVCGESNPIGMQLRMETDGRIVRTRFVPRVEHVGFKNTVHGGIVATLLDEVMAWACPVGAKQFAYCAELTVRFVRPVRPRLEVVATAEIISNRRNKLFEAKAELCEASGTILATAKGKYLPVDSAILKDMATDLVGDAEMVYAQEHVRES